MDLIESTMKKYHDQWKNEQKRFKKSSSEEKLDLLLKQHTSLLHLLKTFNVPSEEHNNFKLPIFYDSFKDILNDKILANKMDEKTAQLINALSLTTRNNLTSILPNFNNKSNQEIIENINKNIGIVNNSSLKENSNTSSNDPDDESKNLKKQNGGMNNLIEKFDNYVDDKVIPYSYGYDDCM